MKRDDGYWYSVCEVGNKMFHAFHLEQCRFHIMCQQMTVNKDSPPMHFFCIFIGDESSWLWHSINAYAMKLELI